jgi:O-antigen ligase
MRSLLLLDLEGKDFTRHEKSLYFLLAAFFITLYLPRMPVVNNLFIGLIFMHCLRMTTWAAKKQLFRERKALIFIFLFFGLQVISALVSGNRQEGFAMLAMRSPLFLFPLSIGLIHTRKELKFRILLVYCITVVLAGAICLITAWVQFKKSGDMTYLYDDGLTEAIDRQSIYFSLMVDFALFAFTYLLFKRSFAIEHPGGVYLCIAFLLVIQFMLASRIAIIGLYCGLLVIALAWMIKNRKLVRGMTLIFTLVGVVLLLVHWFPKTMDKFKELTYTSYQFDARPIENRVDKQRVNPEQWNGMNIRLAVWRCAGELIQQHWLLGVPLGDKQERLMAVYRSKGFEFALATRRNMHSTYLDVLGNVGVVGLIIFLLGFLVLPAIACYKENDALGGFILISFAIALSTETYIDKSVGCILLGFFISFVLSTKKRV